MTTPLFYLGCHQPHAAGILQLLFVYLIPLNIHSLISASKIIPWNASEGPQGQTGCTVHKKKKSPHSPIEKAFVCVCDIKNVMQR